MPFNLWLEDRERCLARCSPLRWGTDSGGISRLSRRAWPEGLVLLLEATQAELDLRWVPHGVLQAERAARRVPEPELALLDPGPEP